MNKLKFLFVIGCSLLLWTSCAKGPGEGGRASITGRVFATNYNNNYVAVDSGNIGGINVYIKYGDDPGIADNTDTDPNGVFRFNFLREGKYSIIVYSKKLVNNVLDSAVISTVEIKSRKEEVNLPVMKINTFKN
ncbi:MAG: carboxypeptidase regulatory-like domain-containing protein [Chitinophagaceae bacterium]|nr:carboxypeptidase regulatory-like domain-containing protein [Chitinophagaceae bacterium]